MLYRAMRIDVHQHIWTEPLLDALAAREMLPFVRRADGVTVLHSAAEQPYVIDVEAEATTQRAKLVHADGLDLALVAISSPIGIEQLPHEAAAELIDAHLTGVCELPEEFAPWGPVALEAPDPADVDRVLERGCVGVSLPAAALAGREAIDAAGPLLERIAARKVPLLIHPGGASAGRREASLGEPLWWRALTDYVAQMQAAWLTFAAFGRREHPTLRVVFTMLAGCAPLQHERLAARGGPPSELRDPLVFYDTSSYGPDAIEAMARVVGAGQLVYGSDRPVVEPHVGRHELLLAANAGSVL
jgi:predicted TIM-barrel fold metal-dependent hydrolase